MAPQVPFGLRWDQEQLFRALHNLPPRTGYFAGFPVEEIVDEEKPRESSNDETDLSGTDLDTGFPT